jgi:Spy/CpxP family protein refolding chaperone
MEKRRKEVEAKMLAVLTPAQRKQWAEMTGPAFKFKQLPPRG